MMARRREITVPNAARRLGISRQSVLKAIKVGRLKARVKTVRIPKRVWAISPKSLDAYVVSSSHQERGLKNPL